MNWYFACWYKFRKAKSYFYDFWVGRVRNGYDHLVHETLKPVSKEWVCEFSWFFACWLLGSNFWLDWHCALYLWLLNASRTCWTPSSSWKGTMKYGLSILPSCFLLGYFVGIGSLGFSEFRQNLIKLWVPDFFWKMIFAPKNWGNEPKIGFFELREKFGHKAKTCPK